MGSVITSFLTSTQAYRINLFCYFSFLLVQSLGQKVVTFFELFSTLSQEIHQNVKLLFCNLYRSTKEYITCELVRFKGAGRRILFPSITASFGH